MVEQNTAVALLESLCIAFEDIEEFLDDRLIDGVVIACNDNPIHDIAVYGDVFTFERSRVVIKRHENLIIPFACFFLAGLFPRLISIT